MGLFNRKKEIREDQMIDQTSISDPILNAILGKDGIDRETIMNIPAISACINKIGDTVSSLQIKLYKKEGDKKATNYKIPKGKDPEALTLEEVKAIMEAQDAAPAKRRPTRKTKK